MLKRENLSDKLADIIGTRIIQNELKPSESISISQLSQQWDVSQSPVRDALHLLERKRLVKPSPKGGYQVADLSIDFIKDFYDAINILFQYAYAKAAVNATEKDLGLLSEVLKQVGDSFENNDLEVFIKGATKYCSVVLRASGNALVEKMALELMPNAERIQWASLTFQPDLFEKSINIKQKEYQYIRDRNSEMAAKIFGEYAYMHIEAALKRVEQEEAASSKN